MVTAKNSFPGKIRDTGTDVIEKTINVPDISKYNIKAQVNIDNNSQVFINGAKGVTKQGTDCASYDGCAGCGGSYCTNAWVRYNVNFPESKIYLMTVRLKHDFGCDSNQLSYYLAADNGFSTTYYATKGDDSWENAVFNIGYVTAGTHEVRFALGHDCCCSPDDLNGFVDSFTFSPEVPELNRGCCGDTAWVDVTSYFKTCVFRSNRPLVRDETGRVFGEIGHPW